jgi:hypothetical protein
VWRQLGVVYELELARRARAPEEQMRRADALLRRGLTNKGWRHVLCGVVGRRMECTYTQCRFRVYKRFRCRNRYCPNCGPVEFRRLMARYRRLSRVVEELVPNWKGDPHYRHRAEVVAKLDITTRNLGRMPTAEEVRLFNKLIKKWMYGLRLPRGKWGLAWCDEFGGHNTNLHAHGVYAGPWVPQAELSRRWREVCAGTVFEGSYIVSIKRARSFEHALAHALKYPGKYVSLSDPERLAELEKAFHQVRRVHVLGAFYNGMRGRKEEDVPKDGVICPLCGSAMKKQGDWEPVWELEEEGLLDLEGYERPRLGKWIRLDVPGG